MASPPRFRAYGIEPASPSRPKASIDFRGVWPVADDLTALSHWFPLVEAAGLPVPRTIMATMPEDVQRAIFSILWGEDPGENQIEEFMADLRRAAEPLGRPLFLRTDFTSGKHSWDSACFVADPARIGDHVFSIVEHSEMAGIIGLPSATWAAREMLPTMPVAVCPNFGNMPVCKEFRFFVRDGEIECFHPYWPRHALEQGGCDLSDAAFAALCDPEDEAALRRIASEAGKAVGGRWSVDLLATERGWFLTDMAEADKSYHWEGCFASVTGTGTAETAQQVQGEACQNGQLAGDAQTTQSQSVAPLEPPHNTRKG